MLSVEQISALQKKKKKKKRIITNKQKLSKIFL